VPKFIAKLRREGLFDRVHKEPRMKEKEPECGNNKTRCNSEPF